MIFADWMGRVGHMNDNSCVLVVTTTYLSKSCL
jgi:hypothetical protein